VILAGGTILRDERRRQHVFEDGALRQQRVVLKHESDVTVAKRRKSGLIEHVRIVAVQRDRSRRRRVEGAQNVEQRALAAP
jgi:hypothetical protein